MLNKWEAAARAEKVKALVEVCRMHGITAADATNADAQDWSMAATAAKVNAPSRVTQLMVIEALKTLEAK